jgi:geranylgeranyl diphosphate synthase type II
MQVIQAYHQLFEEYRLAHPFLGHPTELYDPVNYIMELGGKRLRPVLALMGYELFHQDVKPALPLAYAVEIFHNFSLVHDDIMDAAPLRRGNPTVHTKWNLNAGILSGDVMLIAAYDYLLKVQAVDRLPEIISVFNRVAREVCEGQQMDINFETSETVSIPDYLRMIELKTSVLIAGALEMAAIAAQASPADVQHLYEFGRNIGIAFQLQDDILDTFGEGEKVGKMIGGDIVQNKKTYLILKALELADAATRQQLHELMTTPTEDAVAKVSTVTEILLQLNILEQANAEKNRFQEIAFAHLDAVKVPAATKTPLRELTEALMGREK